MERRRYSRSGGAPDADAGNAGSGEPPTQLRVRSFEMKGGRLGANMGALGGETMEVDLPALHLRDLGGRKGASPGEIGQVVASEILKRALATVARSSIDQAHDQLRKGKLGKDAEAVAKKAAKQLLDGFLGRD